jgi:hypothetical protein
VPAIVSLVHSAHFELELYMPRPKTLLDDRRIAPRSPVSPHLSYTNTPKVIRILGPIRPVLSDRLTDRPRNRIRVRALQAHTRYTKKRG